MNELKWFPNNSNKRILNILPLSIILILNDKMHYFFFSHEKELS